MTRFYLNCAEAMNERVSGSVLRSAKLMFSTKISLNDGRNATNSTNFSMRINFHTDKNKCSVKYASIYLASVTDQHNYLSVHTCVGCSGPDTFQHKPPYISLHNATVPHQTCQYDEVTCETPFFTDEYTAQPDHKFEVGEVLLIQRSLLPVVPKEYTDGLNSLTPIFILVTTPFSATLLPCAVPVGSLDMNSLTQCGIDLIQGGAAGPELFGMMAKMWTLKRCFSSPSQLIMLGEMEELRPNTPPQG